VNKMMISKFETAWDKLSSTVKDIRLYDSHIFADYYEIDVDRIAISEDIGMIDLYRNGILIAIVWSENIKAVSGSE